MTTPCTGTVIQTSGHWTLLCVIQPDIINGNQSENVYAFWVRRQETIAPGARVRCVRGAPFRVPGVLEAFVTILERWDDPAQVLGLSGRRSVQMSSRTYTVYKPAKGSVLSLWTTSNHRRAADYQEETLDRWPGRGR